MLDVNSSVAGFASCVVQVRTDEALVCLGPSLQIVELARDVACVEELDDEGVATLRALRFLCESDTSTCALPGMLPAVADAYVVTTDGDAGCRLAACLGRLDASRTWSVLGGLDGLADISPGAVLVVAQPTEDLAMNLAFDAIARDFTVLWSGETTAGVHVGPLFRSATDIENYQTASFGHAFARELQRLGFASAWPCSLLQTVARDPEPVAHAIIHLLDRALDDPFLCYDVEGGRMVRTWSAACTLAIDPGAIAEQCWDKGLFRRLEVRPIDDVPVVYVATCRTPPSGVAYLETNSGKGLSAERAARGAIGEAVERFAAWRANDMLQAQTLPHQQLTLSAFHPFGGHHGASTTLLPMTAAHDVRTGERIAVPTCLVPFPYVHAGPAPTISSTIGLAVHPVRDDAVVAAALELIERDDFLTGLTEDGVAEAFENLAMVSPEAGRLMEAVQRAGLDITVIRYRATMPHVVHAVLHDPTLNGVSFGSGSGAAQLADAVERAVTEALQVREQLRRVALEPVECRGRYDDCSEWLAPAFVDAVLRHAATAVPVPIPFDAGADVGTALDVVVKHIERLGSRLLVVDLPSPVRGWHAVRALAPGLCLHPHRSDSAGGRRLPKASLVARSERIPPAELAG